MIAFDDRNWISIERPGYLGSRREEAHAGWDREYGKGNWRLAWKFNEHYYDRSGMEMLYEDAYFQFLKNNPQHLQTLVEKASEVYDDAITNIQSGFDYSAQETGRTHLQDIAIRRCLVRFGRVFEGKEPIQIRDKDGKHPLSLILSPGQVPFHYPEVIEKPEIEGWWMLKSVESFYQSNKYLQKLAN